MNGVVLGAFVLLTSAVLAFGIRELQRLLRTAKIDWSAWRSAASQLGLDFAPGNIGGQIGDFAVSIQQVESDTATTMITVQPTSPRIEAVVSLVKEPSGSIQRLLAGPDLLTGDREFDRLIRVQADELRGMAVLDHRTRQAIVREVEAGVELGYGKLRWRAESLVDDAALLVNRVRGMVEIAAALKFDEARLPEILARNAVEEPVAAVQAKMLGLLVTRYGSTAPAVEASRRLLGAADPRVRLLAASLLGAEAFATLESLAEGWGIEAAIRCAALRALASTNHPQAGSVLVRALDNPNPEIRRAAIEGIGKLAYQPALVPLLDLLAPLQGAPERTDAETLAAIVGALGSLADGAAESALLDLLENDSLPVRLAAMQALGRVGSAGAVEPLLGFTKGIRIDAQLKAAARAAIAGIQSRLEGVEEGRLTLAEPSRPGGALSLASDAGSLSMAAEEPVPPAPRTTAPEAQEGQS